MPPPSSTTGTSPRSRRTSATTPTAPSVTAATGPICGGSSTWQYGRFITASGASYVLDPNTGNTNTFRRRTAADVYNYGATNFMQRNDQKWSGGGFARYKFSDKVEPYAEVMVMDDYSDAQIAPSGDFGNTSPINCDNPMLSDQQRAHLHCGYETADDVDLIIMRRNVEGGPRVDQLRHMNYRLLGGVRGDISPAWSYDVYGMHGQGRSPGDVHQRSQRLLASRTPSSSWGTGTIRARGGAAPATTAAFPGTSSRSEE